MPPFGLSSGLSLRESPWDPALTYRALTDLAAVDFLQPLRGCERIRAGRSWMDRRSLRSFAPAGLAKGAVRETGSRWMTEADVS